MPAKWQKWYPHNIDAWQGSARIQDLSDAAYRGYHNLIQAQYQAEDGMLPADDVSLARLSRMRDAWPSIRAEVMACFETSAEGKLFSVRQFAEWEKGQTIHNKRVIAADRTNKVRGRSPSRSPAHIDIDSNKDKYKNKEVVTQKASVTQESSVGSKPLAQSSGELHAGTPQSRLLGTIPCIGKVKQWPLYEAKVDEWQRTYPGISVVAELRKARQWIKDNPGNRKTFKGMPRFLNTWLSKEQDRSGNGNGKAGQHRSGNRERVTNGASAWDSAFAADGDAGSVADAFEADDSGIPTPGNSPGDGRGVAPGVREPDPRIRDETARNGPGVVLNANEILSPSQRSSGGARGNETEK